MRSSQTVRRGIGRQGWQRSGVDRAALDSATCPSFGDVGTEEYEDRHRKLWNAVIALRRTLHRHYVDARSPLSLVQLYDPFFFWTPLLETLVAQRAQHWMFRDDPLVAL